jgi:hypothetical protein
MYLGAHHDWNAEGIACGKLAATIKPHLYRGYMLYGSFPETSKRSGLTYLFRRGLPTLVLRVKIDEYKNETITPLCGLCLHPIGYYEASNAGAMVPTDEILAHLFMMRGDEHLFWRRANQLPWEDVI